MNSKFIISCHAFKGSIITICFDKEYLDKTYSATRYHSDKWHYALNPMKNILWKLCLMVIKVLIMLSIDAQRESVSYLENVKNYWKLSKTSKAKAKANIQITYPKHVKKNHSNCP